MFFLRWMFFRLRPDASRMFPGAALRRSAYCALILVFVGAVTVAPLLHAQAAAFSYAQNTLPVGDGLKLPSGAAVDASGNVYIADSGNNRVLKVPSTDLSCSISGDCTTVGSGLSNPQAVAVDASGNVYIADNGNNRVLKVPSTDLACATASDCVALGSKLSVALSSPSGVAVDSSGSVYVGDSSNNRVLKISPADLTCATAGDCPTVGSGLNDPMGVAVDASTNVYIADSGNDRVLKVPSTDLDCSTAGDCTTVGSGLASPDMASVDPNDNVYIADTGNSRMLRVPWTGSAYGTQTTIGSDLSAPKGVAVGGNGYVYVADTGNARVLQIQTNSVNFNAVAVQASGTAETAVFVFTSGGQLGSTPYKVVTQGATGLDFAAAASQETSVCNAATTYASGDTCTVNVSFTPTLSGARYGAASLYNASGAAIATAYLQGIGTGPQVAFPPGVVSQIATSLSYAFGVAVDGSGNIYATDYYGEAVHKYAPGGSGSYTQQSDVADGVSGPTGVAVDGSGNIYVADYANDAVHKYMPNGSGGYTQQADVTATGLSDPEGVAVDGSGDVYVADSGDNAVRKYSPNGSGGYTQQADVADGLSIPYGVAVDGNGTVYIADYGDNSVYGYAPNGSGGYTQQLDLNILSNPEGVAVDGNGNIYVANTGNDAVLEFTPNGSGGFLQPIDVIDTGLNDPVGVAVDGKGNIYVADAANNRILKVDIADPPSLSFGTVSVGATSGPQTVALKNIGNEPLTFPVPVTGDNPSIAANFALDKTTTCPMLAPSSSAGTLPSGASCTLAVDFEPTAAGMITGSLNVTDDNLNAAAPGYATQIISLNGTGIQMALAPAGGPLPAATLGVAYRVTFSASGGTPSYTYSSIGLPPGLTLNPSSGVLSGTPTAAGPYSLTVTATDQNNVSESQNYTLQVNQAKPSVSGTAPTLTYGQSGASTVTVTGVDGITPTGTVSYSIDGGAAQSVSLVDGSASVPIPNTLMAGSHTIALTYNGDTNYIQATGSVSFSVQRASIVLLWVAPASVVYGTALSGTQLDATATHNGQPVSGTFTYDPAAGAILNAGRHTLSATFTPANPTDYVASISITTSISVTQAATTTTLSVSAASITPGQSLTLTAHVASSTTGTPTGTVIFYDGSTQLDTAPLNGGTASYTTSSLAPGATHMLTASYSGDINFKPSSSGTAIPVPVAPLGFSMSLTGSQSQTVDPGGATAFNFKVSPTYGTYPGIVTFTASGLPAGATATFSPSTIAANGGAQTMTMTIQTAESAASLKSGSLFGRNAPLVLSFLLFPLLGLRRARRTLFGRSLMLMLVIAAGIIGMASLSGCGTSAGPSGQGSQSYTVTVTATSGPVTQTAAVTLNVK